MLVEAAQVNRTELLHQHACRTASHIHFGSKRRGGGTSRRRCDKRRGEPEERVGLHDHGVARATLLVAAPVREPDAVDVAARHLGQSAEMASMSSMTAWRSAVSLGS